MPRLILGAVLASFLALIGVQSVHAHAAQAPDDCSVCAVGRQAQRHAPAAAPRVAAAVEQTAIAPAALVLAPDRPTLSLRARDPPSAS